jgi:hypothetical protein
MVEKRQGREWGWGCCGESGMGDHEGWPGGDSKVTSPTPNPP